ncbi:hypothetical protein QFZ63_000768 [Streptomyces sp. B3I7]|uniref:hypothetical protein n=1 Tax=unclassified Streptomyces TaxID=2593676 RepID=UPI00278953CC|nr:MULTISPECIES: hypothetical protein [unclassified Streptomyces]MDQ0791226.1 hypothetical protein [Streptomyces sp. B3I8]MDQ0809054.1 hypothetical protein [Streptomyces sp. B3I7]
MSDELATALRELASAHEAAAPVPPAEIRVRARRRLLRRRVTAAFGAAATAACALTVAAFTLHEEGPAPRHHRSAAASGTAPRPVSTPAPRQADGSLDLGGHTLHSGDRVLRIDSASLTAFPTGGTLTVTAKRRPLLLPDAAVKGRASFKVPYVVELRTADNTQVYAGALAPEKAAGSLGTDTGWLGLGAGDAKWFYDRARVGDRFEVTTGPVPETRTPWVATSPTR